MLPPETTSLMSNLSPEFLIVGIFSLSVGVLVTGIKFLIWSVTELKEYLNKKKVLQ